MSRSWTLVTSGVCFGLNFMWMVDAIVNGKAAWAAFSAAIMTLCAVSSVGMIFMEDDK